MHLHGMWIFQLPGDDGLSRLDWGAINESKDYYRDGLGWAELVIHDVGSELSLELSTESVADLGLSSFGTRGQRAHVRVRQYVFGICTVLLTFDNHESHVVPDLSAIGKLFDDCSSNVHQWLSKQIGLASEVRLAKLWGSCVVSLVNEPEIANELAEVVRKSTEVVDLTHVGEGRNSLVGNKFSIFNATSESQVAECLELFDRAHAYAAGMYRYERLTLRELARLSSRGKLSRHQVRESTLIHNGVRMIRALWNYQFIAAPVNLREIQGGFWRLWDMDLLVGGVAEMSEKISSMLTAKREEQRNVLTARLNWIVLLAALVQVIVAVVAVRVGKG